MSDVSAVTTEEELVVENARIVTPTGVRSGSLTVIDGEIFDVESTEEVGARGNRTLNAGNNLVMPGIIDLHGDDIESHLFPRTGARTDDHLALTSVDRANVAAGVTTKCHAISFQDAPDEDRSADLAREIVEMVEGADHLLGNHRIHARCELTDQGCVEAVTEVLDADAVVMTSLMAHVPGQGQFASPEHFKQWYMQHRDFEEDEVDGIIDSRQGIGENVFDDRIERVVDAARAANLTVASHDDENPDEIARRYEQGVTLSEYPVTFEAIDRAAEVGMSTAMGAPNLVRGGSQWGNLATETAIATGTVDILCADYHPPSLLAAPFVETGEPLQTRVNRVTKNPADAIGLTNRGRIEPDAVADLLVVDPDPMPTVERAIVGGEEVYRAGGRS